MGHVKIGLPLTCPIIFSKAIAFAMIHLLPTGLLAMQQSLGCPPRAACPASQHDNKAMNQDCIPTTPCIPHMHAPFPEHGAPRASLCPRMATD